MRCCLSDFDNVDAYFEPKCKSYTSSIVAHKISKRSFLLTRYNLEMLNVPQKVMYDRIMFMCRNYKMFRCEAVFFNHHISSLAVIKPHVIGKFLKTFYVLEPLPMMTLADYATTNEVTPEFMQKNLPNLLSTLSALHSAKFPYLSLSPFTIIVDDTFWLRPPSISPYSPPKSLFPPAPKSHRSFFRSANEQRFYRSPEWNAVPAFFQSDCWGLAAILAEYLITKGPLFGSLSTVDQMNRTQMILGPAPAYLNWSPPPKAEKMDLPEIIRQMLDYDPRRRPLLCPHFAAVLIDFIGSFGKEDINRKMEAPQKRTTTHFGEESYTSNAARFSHVTSEKSTSTTEGASASSEKSTSSTKGISVSSDSQRESTKKGRAVTLRSTSSGERTSSETEGNGKRRKAFRNESSPSEEESVSYVTSESRKSYENSSDQSSKLAASEESGIISSKSSREKRSSSSPSEKKTYFSTSSEQSDTTKNSTSTSNGVKSDARSSPTDNHSTEHPTSDELSSHKKALQRSLSRNSTSENPTSESPSSEQTSSPNVESEKSQSARSTSEPSTSEKTSSDQQSSEKSASSGTPFKKDVPEKPPSEGRHPDTSVSEKSTSAEKDSQRESIQKKITESPTSGHSSSIKSAYGGEASSEVTTSEQKPNEEQTSEKSEINELSASKRPMAKKLDSESNTSDEQHAAKRPKMETVHEKPNELHIGNISYSAYEEERPSSVFKDGSNAEISSPISQPSKTSAPSVLASNHEAEIGSSARSYYSSSISSQEYEELRMRIEKIEKVIESAKRSGKQKDESDQSSDGFEDAVKEISSMKKRLQEYDQKLLNGCSGCAVGEIVDKGLRKEAMILEQTLDELNSDH